MCLRHNFTSSTQHFHQVQITSAEEPSQRSLHNQQLTMTVRSLSTEVPPTGEKKSPLTHAALESHLSMFDAISAKWHYAFLPVVTYKLKCLLSDTQSDKSTFWGVDTQNTHTHTAKQLITIYTVFGHSAPGCRCALLSFHTRAKDSLIVAGETRVALLSQHLYEHAPIPGRPFKGESGWRM